MSRVLEHLFWVLCEIGTEAEETVDYGACDSIALPDGSTGYINLTRDCKNAEATDERPGRGRMGRASLIVSFAFCVI